MRVFIDRTGNSTNSFRAIAAISALLVFSSAMSGCRGRRSDSIVVGSKNFTEQIILAELVAQQIEAHTTLRVERRINLGGTLICHQALVSGQLDIYPEYTGTALTVILSQPPMRDPAAVFAAVKSAYAQRFAVDVLPPLGFENTFAIVVRGEDARQLHLRKISELTPLAPKWKAGFGYEFMERPDGYRGWSAAYGLHFASDPRILDLGLLYRALADHQVDVVAGNSTDGVIAAQGLAVLEDDRHYFPPYEAVLLVRGAALDAHPEVRAALEELSGRISADEMRRMNYDVDGQHRDPGEVVREFRLAKGF